MRHRQQHRLQFETFLCQHVFETARFDGPLLENALADESIEARAEDVAGDAQTLLKLFEALLAEERFAKDQQGPALADDVERQRERAVHVVERFELHGAAL